MAVSVAAGGWHTWICGRCGRPKAAYNSDICRLCYDSERTARGEATRNRPRGPAPRPWTEAEDAYLREHYPIDRADVIAEHLGRSYDAVVIRAMKYKLKSRQRAGMHSLVPGYFRTIDTPMKAYLLGLLLADGSVSPTGQVQLDLHRKDRCLVELARDEIAPDARIGERQTKTSPTVRFVVQSAELAADLARHQVVPTKTLITKWPNTVPKRLENSFACGYYDGDGSLDARHPYRASIVSGNRDFLVDYQGCVQDHLGFRMGGPYRDTRHEHAWSIVTTGVKQVTKLDAWLHRDVPGLARKRLR